MIKSYTDPFKFAYTLQVCWNYTDILMYKFSPTINKVAVSSASRDLILDHQHADLRLYEYANATLWSMIKSEVDFYADLQYYRNVKQKLINTCKANPAAVDSNFLSQIDSSTKLCSVFGL